MAATRVAQLLYDLKQAEERISQEYEVRLALAREHKVERDALQSEITKLRAELGREQQQVAKLQQERNLFRHLTVRLHGVLKDFEASITFGGKWGGWFRTPSSKFPKAVRAAKLGQLM